MFLHFIFPCALTLKEVLLHQLNFKTKQIESYKKLISTMLCMHAITDKLNIRIEYKLR